MASFATAVKFTAVSSGTGDFVVSAAVAGYQTPASAQATDAQIYKYRAANASGTEWEEGYGAYTVSSTTLARTTVLFNSAGTQAKISFTSAPQVAIVAHADDVIPIDGALFGLTLSTAGASATFATAAGWCADSTAVNIMRIYTAISKTTSAWAVGSTNGGLDTGSIANSTWYHAFVIKRLDTGVTDVLVSLSATTPTMPTNYTLKRRIGSLKTNGSAQWTKFYQNNDEFIWDVPVSDASALAITNVVQSITLTVPTGFVVNALFQGDFSNTSAGSVALIYSPATGTQSTSTPSGNWGLSNQAANQFASNYFAGIRTNTSAQVNAVGSSASGNSLFIITQGWIDNRGKLS